MPEKLIPEKNMLSNDDDIIHKNICKECGGTEYGFCVDPRIFEEENHSTFKKPYTLGNLLDREPKKEFAWFFKLLGLVVLYFNQRFSATSKTKSF